MCYSVEPGKLSDRAHLDTRGDDAKVGDDDRKSQVREDREGDRIPVSQRLILVY